MQLSTGLTLEVGMTVSLLGSGNQYRITSLEYGKIEALQVTLTGELHKRGRIHELLPRQILTTKK